jgi:MipA family protein
MQGMTDEAGSACPNFGQDFEPGGATWTLGRAGGQNPTASAGRFNPGAGLDAARDSRGKEMSRRRAVIHVVHSLAWVVSFMGTLAASPAVVAEQKPLWELGMGIGAVSLPDYRGSDERRTYPVPVPYFVYRGDFFKADRDGVRGELFDSNFAELSISAHATTPVESDDNEARRGMKDLSPTLELGPSLDLHVWRSPDERFKLDVVMPIRVPITVESSPRYVGWVFAPRINLDVEHVAGKKGWNLGLGAGPVFAARKFNDYFYSVKARDVTVTRPAYEAEGGYSGFSVLTSLSKKFPKYWVGAYMSYGALSGAGFEDSPLVKTKSSLSGGIGIAWMIGESSTLVESEDD